MMGLSIVWPVPANKGADMSDQNYNDPVHSSEQDLEALIRETRSEIDAINGVVCAYGKKLGVPTPYNDKVVEIVHGIEDGKYTYCFDNVKLFAGLKK